MTEHIRTKRPAAMQAALTVLLTAFAIFLFGLGPELIFPASDPSIHIEIVDPTSGTFFGPLQVQAQYEGKGGLKAQSLSLSIDGQVVDSQPAGGGTKGAVVLHWDTTQSENGTHRVTVLARAEDPAAGPFESAPIFIAAANVLPDTTPPTIEIASPREGQVIDGDGVLLQVRFSDDRGVANDTAVVRLDGGDITGQIQVSNFGISHLLTLEPGRHTVEIDLKDMSGNAAQTARATFETRPSGGGPGGETGAAPVVTFTAPFEGETLNDPSVIVNAMIEEESGRVDPGSFLILVDGQDITNGPSTRKTDDRVEIVLMLENGLHTISISVADMAGNRSETATLGFDVFVEHPEPGPGQGGLDDLTAPTVYSVFPEDGSRLAKSPREIIVVAEDDDGGSGLGAIEVVLDGQILEGRFQDRGGERRVTLGSPLDHGAHALLVRASDKAGNVSEPYVSGFEIEEPTPSGSPQSPEWAGKPSDQPDTLNPRILQQILPTYFSPHFDEEPREETSTQLGVADVLKQRQNANPFKETINRGVQAPAQEKQNLDLFSALTGKEFAKQELEKKKESITERKRLAEEKEKKTNARKERENRFNEENHIVYEGDEIVVKVADYESGINPNSIILKMNRDLLPHTFKPQHGANPAEIRYRPPEKPPKGTRVYITLQIRDNAGNPAYVSNAFTVDPTLNWILYENVTRPGADDIQLGETYRITVDTEDPGLTDFWGAVSATPSVTLGGKDAWLSPDRTWPDFLTRTNLIQLMGLGISKEDREAYFGSLFANLATGSVYFNEVASGVYRAEDKLWTDYRIDRVQATGTIAAIPLDPDLIDYGYSTKTLDVAPGGDYPNLTSMTMENHAEPSSNSIYNGEDFDVRASGTEGMPPVLSMQIAWYRPLFRPIFENGEEAEAGELTFLWPLGLFAMDETASGVYSTTTQPFATGPILNWSNPAVVMGVSCIGGDVLHFSSGTLFGDQCAIAGVMDYATSDLNLTVASATLKNLSTGSTTTVSMGDAFEIEVSASSGSAHLFDAMIGSASKAAGWSFVDLLADFENFPFFALNLPGDFTETSTGVYKASGVLFLPYTSNGEFASDVAAAVSLNDMFDVTLSNALELQPFSTGPIDGAALTNFGEPDVLTIATGETYLVELWGATGQTITAQLMEFPTSDLNEARAIGLPFKLPESFSTPGYYFATGTLTTNVANNGQAFKSIDALVFNGDAVHGLLLASNTLVLRGDIHSAHLKNNDQATGSIALGQTMRVEVRAKPGLQDLRVSLLEAAYKGPPPGHDSPRLFVNGVLMTETAASSPYSTYAADVPLNGQYDQYGSLLNDLRAHAYRSGMGPNEPGVRSIEALRVLHDFDRPASPTITLPVDGTESDDPTPRVEGTAETGAKVRVLLGETPPQALAKAAWEADPSLVWDAPANAYKLTRTGMTADGVPYMDEAPSALGLGAGVFFMPNVYEGYEGDPVLLPATSAAAISQIAGDGDVYAYLTQMDWGANFGGGTKRHTWYSDMDRPLFEKFLELLVEDASVVGYSVDAYARAFLAQGAGADFATPTLPLDSNGTVGAVCSGFPDPPYLRWSEEKGAFLASASPFNLSGQDYINTQEGPGAIYHKSPIDQIALTVSKNDTPITFSNVAAGSATVNLALVSNGGGRISIYTTLGQTEMEGDLGAGWTVDRWEGGVFAAPGATGSDYVFDSGILTGGLSVATSPPYLCDSVAGIWRGAVEVVSDTVVNGVFGATSADLGAPGQKSLYAVAVDLAGNVSPPSDVVAYILNEPTLGAPVITSPANGTVSNNPTPTISGTADPDVEVSIFEGDLPASEMAIAPGEAALSLTHNAASGGYDFARSGVALEDYVYMDDADFGEGPASGVLFWPTASQEGPYVVPLGGLAGDANLDGSEPEIFVYAVALEETATGPTLHWSWYSDMGFEAFVQAMNGVVESGDIAHYAIDAAGPAFAGNGTGQDFSPMPTPLPSEGNADMGACGGENFQSPGALAYDPASGKFKMSFSALNVGGQDYADLDAFGPGKGSLFAAPQEQPVVVQAPGALIPFADVDGVADVNAAAFAAANGSRMTVWTTMSYGEFEQNVLEPGDSIVAWATAVLEAQGAYSDYLWNPSAFGQGASLATSGVFLCDTILGAHSRARLLARIQSESTGNFSVQSPVLGGYSTYTIYAQAHRIEDDTISPYSEIILYEFRDLTPPVISGLSASPNPFSPNGDGIDDSTTISTAVIEESPDSWLLSIVFSTNTVFSDSGLFVEPPVDGRSTFTYLWDGTGAAAGGDYSIYLDVLDETGNVSEEATTLIAVLTCPIVCHSNADCSDHNALTIDVCLNPGTCPASCLNSPIACNENADCGDSPDATVDIDDNFLASSQNTATSGWKIFNGGSAYYAIDDDENTMWNSATSVPTSISYRFGSSNLKAIRKVRFLFGNASGEGVPSKIAIQGSLEDWPTGYQPWINLTGNAADPWISINPVDGRLNLEINSFGSAYNWYSFTFNDLISGDKVRVREVEMFEENATEDRCVNPGDVGATCRNAVPECRLDSDCDDGQPLTTDICQSPGSLDAFCSHVSCDVECASDPECDDAVPETTDFCRDKGGCSSRCENRTARLADGKPDGIVYSTTNGGQGYDVYFLDEDVNAPVVNSDEYEGQASYSETKGRLSYTRSDGGAFKIYSAKLSGEAGWGLSIIDNQVAADLGAYNADSSLAADSTRLSLLSGDIGDRRIYLKEVLGGQLIELASETAKLESSALSPDGGKIVYVSDANGPFGLYLIDLNDGNQISELDVPSAGSNFDPVFSPDGQWVYFISNRDGRFDVYRISLGGVTTERLTNTAEREEKPSFSTQGDLICSIRNGNQYDIYEIDVETGLKTLAVTTVGNDMTK